MITRNKIQMEIFKAIIGDSNCLHMFDLGSGNVGITTDGYVVNILPMAQIAFSLEKFHVHKDTSIFEEKESDVNLKPTGRMFNDRYLAVEFDGGTFKTYVDSKKLQKFDGCTFKTSGNLDRILAYDSFGMVGLLLPVRYEVEEK